MLEEKPRILTELRPALEGFAGIPQETRLLFSAFRDFEDFQTVGLINHGNKKLSSGLKVSKKYTDKNIHRKINLISRHLISHTQDVRNRGFWNKFLRRYNDKRDYANVKFRARFNIKEEMSFIDSDGFEDFLWGIFSKSVSLKDYDKIVSSLYAIITITWQHMHRTGLKHNFLTGVQEKYPLLDTKHFDFFLGQTPFPARLSRNTKMVIRYHDAIPMFFPHTIPDTKLHQRSHYMALKDNVNRGALFVCTSNAVKGDLVKLFPKAEENTQVIHDIVSSQYFTETIKDERIVNVVKKGISSYSEPNFFNNWEKTRFYDRHIKFPDFKYLMVVSTVEPRKNHGKLLGAWEVIREKINPNLKLIFVGTEGWNNQKTFDQMRPWQERGQLFHLAKISSPDLRALYNRAEAVICPSLSEGFDLSGIEAMLSGGAVVASDIPVHREVYGNNAEYFSPYSVMQCANAIERVIHPDNFENAKKLRLNGPKHGEQYKQENIAPKWHEFFKSNIN